MRTGEGEKNAQNMQEKAGGTTDIIRMKSSSSFGVSDCTQAMNEI